jgi:hypothetical protein
MKFVRISSVSGKDVFLEYMNEFHNGHGCGQVAERRCLRLNKRQLKEIVRKWKRSRSGEFDDSHGCSQVVKRSCNDGTLFTMFNIDYFSLFLSVQHECVRRNEQQKGMKEFLLQVEKELVLE